MILTSSVEDRMDDPRIKPGDKFSMLPSELKRDADDKLAEVTPPYTS